MKIKLILMTFILLYVFSQNCLAKEISDDSKFMIDDILFAPSSFLSSTKDNITLSAYIRTMTKEGKFPDGFQDTVENSERIISIRFKEWGTTFGWSSENNRLFEPNILSIDYKLPLIYAKKDFATAIDLKYSTKKLRESTFRRSLLDFGVISVTGVIDKKITSILTIYGGLTLNYIYYNADAEKLLSTWKPVPFIGLKINVSPRHAVQLVTEINHAEDDYSNDPMWTWHFGLAIGF